MAIGRGRKIGLRRLDRLDDGGSEPERLKAETILDRFRDARELEIEQARNMRAVACRHGEANVERRDLAIDAIERKPQRPRADAIADEGVHEVLHQPGRNRNDSVLAEDRLEQIAQAVIDRRRRDESERLRGAAERLIEAREQLSLEARRKRRARLVDERADALEAEPPQGRAGVVRQPQRRDRQQRQRLGFLPGWQDDDIVGMKA